jgi:hypothetical protein
MSFVDMMTRAFAVATAAVLLTLLGVASARGAARRVHPRDLGGPYRTTKIARLAAAVRPGERMVAAGGALLACAAAPALVLALATLKWEGIGVTLFPALLVVAARLYTSLNTFRGGNLGAARVIAHASLLLDVPLFVFSIIHVRVIEDSADHNALSLAIVAGAFALADGMQALLVLIVPIAEPVRE